MNVAVIGVQAVDGKVRQAGKKGIKLSGRLAVMDARSAHADFQINQNGDRLFQPLGRMRECLRTFWMVNNRPERRARIAADQADEPPEIRTYQRIGE